MIKDGAKTLVVYQKSLVRNPNKTMYNLCKIWSRETLKNRKIKAN